MNQKLPPSRTAPQFVIRFPDESIRDRIREEAEKNGRSMNAEIIQRLQESLEASDIMPINQRPTHAQPAPTGSESSEINIDLYTLAEVLIKTVGKWDPKTIANLQKITAEINKWDPDRPSRALDNEDPDADDDSPAKKEP